MQRDTRYLPVPVRPRTLGALTCHGGKERLWLVRRQQAPKPTDPALSTRQQSALVLGEPRRHSSYCNLETWQQDSRERTALPERRGSHPDDSQLPAVAQNPNLVRPLSDTAKRAARQQTPRES